VGFLLSDFFMWHRNASNLFHFFSRTFELWEPADVRSFASKLNSDATE